MNNRHLFPWATAIFFTLVLAACGGGDGGQPPVTQTTPTDAKVASAAISSVIGGLGGAGDVADSTSGARNLNATGESDARLIRKGLDILKARLKGEQPAEITSGGRVARAVTVTPDPSCTLGGSGSESVDDKGTADPLDDTVTTSYVNCRQSFTPGMEILLNGSESVTGNETMFSSTSTNFERSEIDTASQKIVTYSRTHGTMAGSGITLATCQATSDQFMKGSITITGVSENREDFDKNGVYEIDEVFTSTNFKLDIDEGFDSNTCASTTDTIVMNGAAKLDDKVKPANNFTATFTALNMTMKERKSGATVIGDELTINGQVAISSSCATGTYTITTVTPLFSPVDKDCPTEGKMLITGGGKSTAVIATPSGGFNIDEDNNGSIEKSLPSCDDVEVCS